MLTKFTNLRINFVITFFGAALIMLIIKVTPLLLPRYYFNFSTLLGGGSEPFMVDPPGVTGKKICELMRAHGISESSFNQHISCDINFAESGANKSVISAEEVDKIYDTIIASDASVRAAIAQAASAVAIKQLSDDDIRTLAADDRSLSDVQDAILQHYTDQFARVINDGSASVVAKLDELLKINTTNEAQERPTNDLQLKKLSPDTVSRIVQAHQTLKPQLTSAAFARDIGPIKKSSVDKILKAGAVREDIPSGVPQFYVNSFTDELHQKIDRAFAQFQIASGKERDRELLFKEIQKESLGHYIVSILVRLAPVVLFGFITGAIFGREELLSISLAGALAAFLLSWPLMLMWDRLVSFTWQSKRETFLLFYAVYIFSYLMTAYSFAMFGRWCIERAHLRPLMQRAQEPTEVTLSFTWQKVAGTLMGAVVTNAMLYGWNLIIASNAPTHS